MMDLEKAVARLLELDSRRSQGYWWNINLDTDNPNPKKQAHFTANAYVGESVCVKDKKDKGYVCLVPYETHNSNYDGRPNSEFIAAAPVMMEVIKILWEEYKKK